MRRLKKEQRPCSGRCGGTRVVATECSQVWAPMRGAGETKVGCLGFFPYFLCWFMLSESLCVEHCSVVRASPPWVGRNPVGVT